MGIDVSISVIPSEVPDPIPFPEDRTHATYDPAQAKRFHRVLSMIDLVMKEHRAQFPGRTSPVHFFWGTFDLALTRYSGRSADPLPGDSLISRFSSDAEQICAGWWPGDHRLAAPAFFSYAYPAPDGIEAVQAWSHPKRRGARTQVSFSFRMTRRSHPRIHAVPSATFSPPSYDGAATLLGWSTELTTFSEPGALQSTHPLQGDPT